MSVRAEARVGYETPTVSDGSGAVYKIGSAVSYGGEAGVDLAAGKKITIGVYGNYEGSSVSICSSGSCLSEDGNLAAGGRIGFNLGTRSQLYLKAGYARITMRGTAGGSTGTQNNDGVQGGIGLSFDFGKHFYGMVEASYADYGDFFGIKLQRRHVAAGLGVRF